MDSRFILEVLSCGAASFVVVVIAELLNRRGVLRGEAARKSTHFGIGFMLLVWLSMFGVEVYRVVLVCAVIATMIIWPLGIFKSMRDVKRKTIGHLLYPFGLLIPALFFDDVAANQVALLHLFVVDTAAALVGSSVKSKVLLRGLGTRKTLAGSMTFWIGSLAVFAGFWASEMGFSPGIVLMSVIGASIMTVSELGGFWGVDNLYLPLLSAVIYSML